MEARWNLLPLFCHLLCLRKIGTHRPVRIWKLIPRKAQGGQNPIQFVAQPNIGEFLPAEAKQRKPESTLALLKTGPERPCLGLSLL